MSYCRGLGSHTYMGEEPPSPPAPALAITRHPAMVEHLRSVGLIGAYTSVVEHATPEEVRGEWVVGVLPLALAALAEQVTEVPLHIPEEWTGRELTLAELQSTAGTPVTYRVTVVP
jgi:hypothetical protein